MKKGRKRRKAARKVVRKIQFTKMFAFALITSFLLIFWGLIIYDSPIMSKAMLFAILLFFSEGMYLLTLQMSGKKQNFRNDLEVIVSVTLAAALTFSLNIWGMGPVVAAAAVGFFYDIFASMARGWLKRLSGPVYCGAFVGMCAKFIFVDMWIVGLAGAVAGIVYVISDGVFEGVGGKLGTIAFIGSFSTAIMMGALGVL